MIKSTETIDYIGDELDLFKYAVNWKNYFSDKLVDSIHGDVLEVGAGNGINSKYLAKNPTRITSYTCLEPDEELVMEIEGNIAAIPVEKKIIINGTIKTVATEKYDTIIYIDVLEHIEESRKEVQLAKQLLKPNGRLIILVPAYNFLYNNFDKKIGHFRRYDKKMLLSDVNGELSTVSLFYLDAVGFFASLMNKWFLKKELPSYSNVKLWDNFMIPTSKLIDVVTFKSFGKSLIGIFQNDRP